MVVIVTLIITVVTNNMCMCDEEGLDVYIVHHNHCNLEEDEEEKVGGKGITEFHS
jgi:hypothetical protein